MVLSLLGSANLVAEVDRPLLLTRGVEPPCGVTPWLRKLDRSEALPKSIFEHCVSPSPRGDRSDNALHPSQVAAYVLSTSWERERASLEGSLILLAIATKEKGASRVNDCNAIGGSGGWKKIA